MMKIKNKKSFWKTVYGLTTAMVVSLTITLIVFQAIDMDRVSSEALLMLILTFSLLHGLLAYLCWETLKLELEEDE